MPQFFETVMGKRFFEGQLPKLIKAIENNTAAVEKLVIRSDDDIVYGVVIDDNINKAVVRDYQNKNKAFSESYAVCKDKDDAVELTEILNERMG